MAYVSFDPRSVIRTILSSNLDVDNDGVMERVLVVTLSGDRVYNIPIYFSEEVKSEELPTLPFLELEMVETTYEPHDIGASTRKMESRIDIHIYFPDLDGIDRTTFAQEIKNRMHDLIRTSQSTTSGITFMNIENDVLIPETNGRQVIYHYVARIYALYYDLC